MTKLTSVQAFVASISLRDTVVNGLRTIEILQGKKVILTYVQVNTTTIKTYSGKTHNPNGSERRHSTGWSQTPQDVMDSAQYGVTQYIARQISDFGAGYTKSF